MSHTNVSRSATYGDRLGRYFGRDFSWALSSNVIYSFCQWAFVIVLAKLGTAADVGVYALGLAITSPILMFANFQGRNLVASDVRDQYTFGEHLTFRIVSLVLALVVLSGIAFGTQTSGVATAVILLVGISQCLDYISESYFGLLQKYERMDRVSISLMVKGPASLVLMIIAMGLTHNVVWAVVALALVRLGVLCFIDTPNAFAAAGRYHLMWNRATQTKLLVTVLPLGIISGLCAANLNIPRYFIEGDMGKSDLGIFSALASLVGAGNLVIAALASCSIVNLARAWASGDTKKYRSLSIQLFIVSALMGSLGILFAWTLGKQLLSLLFRPEYAENTAVFVRLMIAGSLGYIVSAQGYALTAARKLADQIPILAGTAMVTLLFAWLLVPKRGLNGAAEAWVLGSVFQLVCNTWLMVHFIRNPSTSDIPRPAEPKPAFASSSLTSQDR